MRAFSEYTFLGLCNHGQPIGTPDLAYLIGLVDSPNHKIVEPFSAKKILTWLFDEEEQVSGAIELLSRQEKFFSRYFRGGFYPQTPVMLTQAWSPIGAMLEHGIKPVALKRENQLRSVATGIWEPTALAGTNSIKDCKTVKELFWAVLSAAFRRAEQRGMLVIVVAKPGWNYETKIGSLHEWSSSEAAKVDRILWKRTPED